MLISSITHRCEKDSFSAASDSLQSRHSDSVFALEGATDFLTITKVEKPDHSSSRVGPAGAGSVEQAAAKTALAHGFSPGEATSIQEVRVSPLHRSLLELKARTLHVMPMVRAQFVLPIQPQASSQKMLGLSVGCLPDRQSCPVEKTWSTSIPVFEIDQFSEIEDPHRIKQAVGSVIRTGKDFEPQSDLKRLNIDTNLDLSDLFTQNRDYMRYKASKALEAERNKQTCTTPKGLSARLSKPSSGRTP